MDFSRVLSCALDIGEQMLVSGAEIYRVEDCIRRICFAYGASHVDVFTITSSIVVTVQQPDGQRLTQTRRIESYKTNLDRVDLLNELSREICRRHMSYAEFLEKYQGILNKKPYPQWVETIGYAMAASGFTMFFGGTWRDGLVALVIGAVVKGVVWLVDAVNFNRVLSNLIAAFAMSILAILAGRCGLADKVDMLVMGSIMLVIPGAALTNSLRDMISGDTMAGLLRFSEACILALAIAAGYLLASACLGGAAV